MEEFIKEKLKILRQLGINVTPAEKSDLLSCQTENQLDRVARKIINWHWDKPSARENETISGRRFA